MFRSIALLSAAAIALLGFVANAHSQEGGRRDEQTPPPPKQPTLTKTPTLVEAAAPEYPAAALEAGLEASVKVRIHIDADGIVTKVDVVEPVGHGFDEAAVAAAMAYVFTPAEWDGVPGPIAVETAIHFTIQEEEVEEEPPPPPKAGDAQDPAATGPPSHGGDMRLPVSIEGEAVERGTRRKLAGVIVSVAELGLDAVTDEQGKFYFHGVPPGEYEILAVADRYDRLARKLTIAKEESGVEVRLWLRKKGASPYETVVEGEREVIEVTKRTLKRRQLTTVPGTFGDPIRVIQSLPGLARSPFVTGLLLIRGSNPDDSGVFIDGHRVPLIYHFLGGPSIINAEFVDQLDLYPGGFPARFGRSIGGIVSIDSRASKSDGFHGSADIDILDAGAYFRVPVGKNGSFSMAGRRSYLNFVLEAFLPEQDDGATLVVVPVYYDYQARFDYNFQREGQLSMFLIGSSDVLDVLSEEPDDESSLNLNTAIRFLRLITTYKRPLTSTLRLTMSPAFGRDSVRFASGQTDAESPFTDVDIVQNTIGYRMRVDGRLHKRVVLDAGIDIESRVTQYDVTVPFAGDVANPLSGQVDADPERRALSFEQLAYGAHVDVGWDVTDRLRLIPGLRLDNYLLSGEARTSLDPRLVARYRISKPWLVKGYVGLFHQPPQPEGFDIEFGNPDLSLERAVHVGLGGEWQPAKEWTVDGEVYYIDRDNLVVFTDETVAGDDPNTVRPQNFLNLGVSDTVGLEVLVRREVTDNLYGWLSYTLSRSMQQRAPDEPRRPTLFDQRHVLNAVASYTFDSGWEVGARFRLSSGAPSTPILSSTFNADSGGYRPVPGPSRSDRVPTFHQLDIRVEKTWVFNTYSLGVYLDVQNLFNIENVEAVQYDYRYRESAPVTSVPFLPTIGVRGQW